MKSIITAVILLTAFSPAYSIYVSDISEINGNEAIIIYINFSNKGLTEVPDQVFKCKNLVSLNLSNNGIVNIPGEFSELSALKKLDLSMNRGLNPMDLDKVFENAKFRLTDLTLHKCNLLYVPSSLNRQAGLKNLDISFNRLTSLPYTFMELSNLEKINVSSNKLRNISWVVNYWWSLKAIDFSDNEGLQASSVLSILSYFDQLDEITLSNLDFFPKEFSLLNVHRLIIKNSSVNNFVRTNLSTKIDQLYFENCQFEKPSAVVEVLNDFVKPDFVHFSKMNPLSLTEFLNLKADSISLYQLGELDIRPLSGISELKWLDVRGNKIEKSSLNEFKNRRPDVKLMFKEPVKKDSGVHPPIPEFVSKPTVVNMTAGIDQDIEIGRSEFSIPAEGILDENGNIYNGPVKLEYREFVTPAEILLSGITMTSDKDDETFLFSSGGMFELNASDVNGNALFVNPEQPVQVEMYSNSIDPEMEIFTLNENGDWDVIGNDSILNPICFLN
ncbi:MAG: leucine-rich repeat domain-containing protein [Crocinitomicaceae bacterium]|nr:leucine-rich repeat domain-containing protein [Crocinitomicaceae bacterium]